MKLPSRMRKGVLQPSKDGETEEWLVDGNLSKNCTTNVWESQKEKPDLWTPTGLPMRANHRDRPDSLLKPTKCPQLLCCANTILNNFVDAVCLSSHVHSCRERWSYGEDTDLRLRRKKALENILCFGDNFW